ncbi:MAG: holo-ACP synthase [Anaerolineales bacterium]|nr:holo-ACP synthase [Anaerolineales bacterium]
MLSSGVDIMEIERFAAVVARKGERFLVRVFTAQEREQCANRVPSLAARWAAKEATAKALGCGIGDIAWRDIEILNDERGAPTLQLHGAARERAEARGLTTWSLSLSHDAGLAIAFVVAMGEGS